MASAGGGVGATDEIPDVDMEVVERPPEEPGRVGSKRVRDSPSANGSYGFYGVTTAEKKPVMELRDADKYLKKAGNVNYTRMNSNGASKIGGPHLYGTHGFENPSDSNALRRLISSSPGENLGNETKRPTKMCTFYAQGRCKKGKNCTFLHEREGPGSAKAGMLASAGCGNHRGSEEGSEVHLSNLKAPQFKNSDGSSKHELYRNLIHVYGEDNRRSTHFVDERCPSTPGVSQGMPSIIDDALITKPTTPTNELVQSPVVHEKNHKPLLGHHNSLAAEICLDGIGGENLQSGADKISRIYLEANTLNSDHQYRSSEPFRFNEKLSAYGGISENLSNTHHKLHHSSNASYSTHSLAGFRNPSYAISEHSLAIPTLRAQSHHLSTLGIEKVGLHKYVDVDKGCGSSRPALLVSSSPQPSLMSAGSLSPIKDEVWETSVPFVPSFNFPDSTSPSRSQYGPFVDSIEPPTVENTNNLKASNISRSISNQHTSQCVITEKSVKCDNKLTRNISAKGSNELAFLVASNRGRSSSLDDNNKVKAFDRKSDAANNEKTRDFRFYLAEHIKELIKPVWKEGNLSKDAHKLVVKKSVEKIIDSIEQDQIPTTEEQITNYITTFGSKIEKLVKAYVDRHRTS